MLPEDFNDALPTRGCARRMGSNSITRDIADGNISDSEVTDSESDSDSDDDFEAVDQHRSSITKDNVRRLFGRERPLHVILGGGKGNLMIE